MSPLKEFREACKATVHLSPKDQWAFDFIAVVICGLHLTDSQEGIWGYLCGPPAGGKTELLRPVLPWQERVVALDTITESAMVSGYDPMGARFKEIAKGKGDPYDPSLLPQLEGKILVLKDLTAILRHERQREAFYGVIRGAYDGEFDKHSGTLGRHGTKVRFGILAGVTEDAMDQAIGSQQAAGERFVVCRIQQGTGDVDGDVAMGLNVLALRDGKRSARDDVSAKAITALDRGLVEVVKGQCDYTREQGVQLALIARELAILRTQRGRFTAVSTERNSRLVQVFAGMCDTRARLAGRSHWNDDDIRFVKRIARDTVPTYCKLMIDMLAAFRYRNGDTPGVPVHEFTTFLGVPQFVVTRQLAQWREAGVVTYSDATRAWHLEQPARARLSAVGMIPTREALDALCRKAREGGSYDA